RNHPKVCANRRISTFARTIDDPNHGANKARAELEAGLTRLQGAKPGSWRSSGGLAPFQRPCRGQAPVLATATRDGGERERYEFFGESRQRLPRDNAVRRRSEHSQGPAQ